MTTYQQRPQIQGPEGGLTLLGDDKSMTITNKICKIICSQMFNLITMSWL